MSEQIQLQLLALYLVRSYKYGPVLSGPYDNKPLARQKRDEWRLNGYPNAVVSKGEDNRNHPLNKQEQDNEL
jgi:hypothetical protein